MFQFWCLCLLAGSSLAAPKAEPQFGAPYAPGPAPNCVTGTDILVTMSCTPRAENICNTQVVETEEIEYEPICKDVVDILCDAPPPGPAPFFAKREAQVLI